jgi:hypothetical protein
MQARVGCSRPILVAEYQAVSRRRTEICSGASRGTVSSTCPGPERLCTRPAGSADQRHAPCCTSWRRLTAHAVRSLVGSRSSTDFPVVAADQVARRHQHPRAVSILSGESGGVYVSPTSRSVRAVACMLPPRHTPRLDDVAGDRCVRRVSDGEDPRRARPARSWSTARGGRPGCKWRRLAVSESLGVHAGGRCRGCASAAFSRRRCRAVGPRARQLTEPVSRTSPELIVPFGEVMSGS